MVVGRKRNNGGVRERITFKKELINAIASTEETGILEDILLTFSNKYYPGDLKIKKTIGEIIHSFAERGHVIIVGRGGVSICRNMKKSLHIKLTAPWEWRINDVSRRHGISLDEAEHKIKSIDYKREMLREHFAGRHQDDTVFDVVYNYMTCSDEEIIHSIVMILEWREMI